MSMCGELENLKAELRKALFLVKSLEGRILSLEDLINKDKEDV
tara:strand:+ start:256 stop:384 length:129 start_codon:yes stop_codon:yes gene_type:complete